ncbi:MAG: long-chain fatty acid--CoA ligase, partial [Deltaproteobacteria bacterium RBG_16_71_12]
LEARGRAKLEETAAERARRLAGITRDTVATYCYTSGTTGAPKGVIQTHGNWLSILEATPELGLFTEASRAHGSFLFLPLAHSFGRLVELSCAYNGGPAVLSGVATLAEDLHKSRPGIFPAAPRVYEKIYGRVMAGVASAPPSRQRLFNWAISVGRASIPYRRRGKRLPLLLALQHRLAERLVYSKLRARLGFDRLESAATGSAPLAPAIHEFFLAVGVMLIEGYGLTETCPILTANRLDRWKLQTVGTPVRNVVIKIAADGEILAKGPNITQGYLNRPDANADAFDAEGWFHTGDIGEFDGEGNLRITDRKKDLLKTSGGKYIAPIKIEGMLKAMPMVNEAVVIGDSRNYCTALLVLDEDGVRAWAARTGNPPDHKHPALLAALHKSLDEVNRELASFESIKYFRVVEVPFSVDNGLLTASFKVKRKEVAKRFADLIEEMYAPGGEGAHSRAA